MESTAEQFEATLDTRENALLARLKNGWHGLLKSAGGLILAAAFAVFAIVLVVALWLFLLVAIIGLLAVGLTSIVCCLLALPGIGFFRLAKSRVGEEIDKWFSEQGATNE